MKKKIKNPIKHLEKLANSIINIIHELNDMQMKDLNLGAKRFALLNQLSNVLPIISELVNHLEVEILKDLPNIGMTTED
jgi:hypothetical protein